MISFACSFDRDSWFGSYKSRDEAIQAGSIAAAQYPGSPTTFYVGQRVTPKLHAFGHARAILTAIRRRVREDNGDQADQFLRNIPDPQVNELDNTIESAIQTWLNRHHLGPQWAKIDRISEHPIQQPRSHRQEPATAGANTHGPDDIASMGETPTSL